MLIADEQRPVDRELPPRLIRVCNGMLCFISQVSVCVFFFISYFALVLLIATEPHWGLIFGVYLFPAALVLTWGHKRMLREAPGSDFSRVFWTIATTHYVVLASAFFSLFFGQGVGPTTVEVVPIDPVRRDSDGLGYIILALAVFVMPAILSLPPLVFTAQRSLKGRPQLGA